jgi:two-component system sensor histidine kinase ChiS
MSFNHFMTKISNQLPLRFVIIVPFVIQIIATVGLTDWLSLRNGQRAVNEVATQLRTEIVARVEQNLRSFLAVPHQVNQDTLNIVNLGMLSPHRLAPWESFLHHQLQLFKTVSLIGIGNEEREFLSLERMEQGEIVVLVAGKETGFDLYRYATNEQGERTTVLNSVKNFDPRLRPWYKVAVQSGKPAWCDIYHHFSDKTLLLNAVLPLYHQDKSLAGVLQALLRLSEMDKFLRALKVGKTGQVFIMERSGLLLATSAPERTFRVKDHKPERLLAVKSDNGLTRATAQYLATTFGNFNAIKESQQLEFNLEDQRQFLQIVPFHDERGLDWLITVVIPENDFMAQIHANTRITILLTLIALVIAILMGFLTTRWIIQPILRINTAAKTLANGQWGYTLPTERADELGQLAHSFNQMAEQLKMSFETLKIQNLELQRLDQLKDDFLANTSHELRTPLNGIIGLTESLLDGVAGELSPQVNTNLSMIVSSGKRLASLINDILDFAKLKHHDLVLKLQPIGLREIVDVVLLLIQPLVGNKPVQLINAIDPNLLPAYADENRLQQILHNLIGNAIKFTPSGQITVSARVADQQLVITVADTGIGIPAEKLDRIFESFEQADSSTAREYGGTGLGLAVTKQLVQLHGGNIWVESQLERGSRFHFTLPITTELPSPSQLTVTNHQLAKLRLSAPIVLVVKTSSESSPLVNQSHFKVLIVDDELVNLQVLNNYLSLEHYQIAQATSGPEALAIIDQGFKPDAILLDVMMPKMTGYEVTRKLREKWQIMELPILMLTAKNQVTDLVRGLDCGANDYLTKPIVKDELLARLKTQLHIKEMQVRLTEARQVAEAANYTKTAFLANLSHELRTPLNGILGFAQLLRGEENLTELQQEGLDTIQQSGEYLLTLVNDILDISQLQTARLELYPTEVYLPKFLKAIVDIFQTRAKQNGLTLIYRPSLSLPTIIWADAKRLRQILIHLLSNAVKFTEQGQIMFQVQSETIVGKGNCYRLRFEVEDTGIGIAPEHLDRILLPFEQVSDWKHKSEGAGLGLSLTKQLVNLMGGQVQIESRLGQGSKFEVILDFPEPESYELSDTETCQPPFAPESLADFSASFKGPSAIQAAELSELAMIGDPVGILDFITKLEQEDAELKPFVEEIRQLSQHFENFRIYQLLQPYMENSSR